MIDYIELKFGAKPFGNHLETEITPITIFVGPNNSGKSKILNEIHQHCSTNNAPLDSVIVKKIQLNDRRDLHLELQQYLEKPIESYAPNEQIRFGAGQRNIIAGKDQMLRAISKQSSYYGDYLRFFVSPYVLVLGGALRINLIASKPTGNLTAPPQNNLAELFTNDLKREEVRKIIYSAFGKYFVIDPTNAGNLSIRLSNIEPKNVDFERSLSSAAIDFYSKTTPIEQFSDGVKAFTGIITSIIAGDPEIILIDEPEAFLHPSLAFNLGKEIAKTAIDGQKKIFASTHSSNFLMGCIQSGVQLNIIRLTYSNNVPTARLLLSDNVAKLMRRPLLRSTGVLNALFYEYVIVTEADADRAFYQEINERLSTYEPEKGIPNCLFLNAQNKQTIHEIIGPLRKMGIPCAAIVDVDVIKEGGNTG